MYALAGDTTSLGPTNHPRARPWLPQRSFFLDVFSYPCRSPLSSSFSLSCLQRGIRFENMHFFLNTVFFRCISAYIYFSNPVHLPSSFYLFCISFPSPPHPRLLLPSTPSACIILSVSTPFPHPLTSPLPSFHIVSPRSF